MTSTYVRQVRDGALRNRHSIRGILAMLLLVVWAPALALDPALQLTQYVIDTWQAAE